MIVFSIRSFLMLILGLAFLQERVQAEEQKVKLSHIEGSGLGYSIGYSSLALFLSNSFDNQNLTPFLDLRGHVFNNGKFAANAGLGLRYFNCCVEQIWGVNVVYDYLQHLQHYPHRSYHQVGAGIEVIGDRWDFHMNAYVPVGHKKTNIYRFKYGFYEDLQREDLSNLEFGLKATEQLALNGIDALFGYRFCHICNTDLHVSAGPYYYTGRSVKTTNAFTKKRESSLGGRFMFDLIYMKYISIGAEVTYDTIFKWRGQGVVSLNIPFDIFNNWGFECTPNCFRDRLYDYIERNEIIAVDCMHRFENNPLVLDPSFQP